MSVESKVLDLVNYITGSAGGWPNLSRAGIVGSVDYTIESGSGDIYFYELNTNVLNTGGLSEQKSLYDDIANYAATQSYDTAYVYGVNLPRLHDQGNKIIKNPTTAQQVMISSSFADHNISTIFEYDQKTASTYFNQRGNSDYNSKFHLFIESPHYSDDNLYNISSGSYEKNQFRSVLSASPISDTLIPLFNTSSYSQYENWPYPDFIQKYSGIDSGISGDRIHPYTYETSSFDWNRFNEAGAITEKFIIGSGSLTDDGSTYGKRFISNGRVVFLSTPEKTIILKNNYNGQYVHIQKTENDYWSLNSSFSPLGVSGSLVRMYDDSTKQIQDIEVGDLVKSYHPTDMSLQDHASISYTNAELSGTMSGSVVMELKSEQVDYHYLINGSIKLAGDNTQAVVYVKQNSVWCWRYPSELAVNDVLLDKDGSELTITSISEVQESDTYYSLDVEDIDTYFLSDILVHNLPPRK
tara:strand:- start:176 stop:1579 length:1404 start_codon:yes stop_codon:yes gene_type:complete